MLCANFGWNWLSGSGEEDFLISSMYFHYFVFISPWKRAGPFIWTNLNPLHPRMLCAKFGWNWPSGSGEDENVKSLQTDRQTDRKTDRRTDGGTDRQTPDDRWSEKLTWAFSSGELKRDWDFYHTWYLKQLNAWQEISTLLVSLLWFCFPFSDLMEQWFLLGRARTPTWKTPVAIHWTITNSLCMIQNRSKWNTLWKPNSTSNEDTEKNTLVVKKNDLLVKLDVLEFCNDGHVIAV